MAHQTSAAGRSAIIFDFFGVICSEVAPFWLARYFDEEEAMTIKRDLVGAADTGEISETEMFARLGQSADVEPEQVLREWIDLAKIDPAMVDLVRNIARVRAVGLLTNSPADFVRNLLRDNGIEDLFRAVLISSVEGCAKPDPKIYNLMLDRMGCGASDALLIDDNPRNLQGAREVGMGAIHFQSMDSLDELVRELQLEVAKPSG